MKRHLVLLAAALASSAFAAAPTRDATGTAGGLEERVARLERMLQARNQVQIELQQQLSDLEVEAGQLRGMLELHSHQIDQILARQRGIYQDIERRLGQASAAPAATTSVSPISTAATPTVVATPAAANSDVAANAAYASAYDLLKNKRFDEASAALAKFVKDYPNSSYVANAYYWQGQISFHKSDLASAKLSFQTVVDVYQKSNKRPQAVYKLGLIAEKQGQTAEAKKRFKQVVTEYPSSSLARMAKGKL